MDINLNYHEQRALLSYLKRHLSKDVSDIKLLEELDALYLLIAYNKLQMAIDIHNNQMAYTD